jgi:hypothetical protein
VVKRAPPTQPRLPAWRALLLAALLLLAQGLGFSHAIAHGGAGTADHGHTLLDGADDHDHGHGSGHEAGSAQCRLVDAHAHGDLATAAAPQLPPVATAPAPPAAGGSTSCTPAPRWHAPARGPPR